MTNESIKIASFNCRSIKNSEPEILNLCDENDILLLQETWLSDHDLPYLSTISQDFYAAGISSMDSTASVCKGRPFGGLASIMWKKYLTDFISIKKYDDDRMMGIEINNSKDRYLILNGYLPYDNGDNLDEYLFYLYKINEIFENYGSQYVMAIGDFNTNTSDINNEGDHLKRFCR